MKFSSLKESILLQFAEPEGNKIVPLVLGAPGGGKSAMCREVARTMFDERGLEMIQYDDSNPETWETANYFEFNASLRDPVDLLGTPNNHGTATRWKAPGEFYAMRRGTGFKFLNLEELSDAAVPMQNGLCAVIYDKRAGNTLLSEELYITATGNRTEDKSGAVRLTSKLADRTRTFTFTESLEDWIEWALDNGIRTELMQFLRFRPGLLSEFDPNRMANPTPRSWERVNRIPESLPEHLVFDNVAGEVGEGAAAEYTGFLRICQSLPDVESILLDPERAQVPTDMATVYALTMAIAKKASKDNFDRVARYTARLKPEFDIMTVKDSLKNDPAIKHTRSYIEWATKNAAVLM